MVLSSLAEETEAARKQQVGGHYQIEWRPAVSLACQMPARQTVQPPLFACKLLSGSCWKHFDLTGAPGEPFSKGFMRLWPIQDLLPCSCFLHNPSSCSYTYEAAGQHNNSPQWLPAACPKLVVLRPAL